MKLGHLTVLTKDIKKSVEFYTLLGGKAISEDVLDLGNGETAVRVLREADIDPGCRAQELGQKEFRRLYERTCLCQD